MRKILVTVSALFIVCSALALGAQGTSHRGIDDRRSVDDAPAGKGALDFEYQFGVVDEDGRERYVAQMPLVHTGDRFVVRVRSAQTAYAYLFVHNGRGEYTLLAPQGDRDGDSLATRVSDRRWAKLPDEESVLRLDENEGVERVYVVVSNRPVQDIEKLSDDAGDASVPETWLVSLRERLADRGRWSRQQAGATVRSIYSMNGRNAVAVEDIAFRHE